MAHQGRSPAHEEESDLTKILKSRMEIFQSLFTFDENEAKKKGYQLYYLSTNYVEKFVAFYS